MRSSDYGEYEKYTDRDLLRAVHSYYIHALKLPYTLIEEIAHRLGEEAEDVEDSQIQAE